VIVTTESRAVATTSVRSTTSTTWVPVDDAVAAPDGASVEAGVACPTTTRVAVDARAADSSDTGRQITKTGINGLNRFDAHAVEQAMINRYGLNRLGGLANKINSVARTDPLFRLYSWRGEQILARHGY
jgi:hypothetical protein